MEKETSKIVMKKKEYYTEELEKSAEEKMRSINNQKYYNRAEIIREKGTNRSSFFRGQTDKYTWIDVGSSFLPGELISAFLFAQLESSEQILNMRMMLWNTYHKSLFHNLT